ncbi:hypothetical protein COU36_05135 [Candidatus Micrarchaeota archaeon CG10_big_fil_rev_8_21_14_0_10_59_7]|nr:MAG: hypothetical protein COU36_05135 [Candidatus Micrarchaeota archaeon CG10_big_fil_rev_8_21_14_0_10_59_7]
MLAIVDSGERKAKALSIGDFFFKLPRQGVLVAYLFALCFSAGVVLRMIAGSPLWDALVFGGTEGILLLAGPALIAAVLAPPLFASKRTLKHFLFIATASSAANILVLLAGTLSVRSLGMELLNFVLIGNAIVFIVWFAACFFGLGLGLARSGTVALVQPFLDVAVMFIWARFGFFATALDVGSPLLAFVKILLAAGVFLSALWAVSYVINAPAKKNFGISTVEAVVLFFSHWVRGGKGLEEVLSEFGEEVETTIGAITFRRKNKSIKSVFVVPYVHFGPFGNLGGSEFPALISKDVEARLGAPTLVFHGTVNHDFNPVYSSSESLLTNAVIAMARRERGAEGRAAFVSDPSGSVAGISFGTDGFLTLSLAPEGTEDINLAIGHALRYKAQAVGFRHALLADRHNSCTDGMLLEIGSPAYYKFEDAISSMSPPSAASQKPFRLGIASASLPFTREQGVGAMGLRVAVFEIGGKRSCYVLVDANNALPGLRARVLSLIKRHGFDYGDLFTTDSHSVNTLSGVTNPLGLRTDEGRLLSAIDAAIHRAVEDAESCTASFAEQRVRLRVFGANRQSELITAINSTVSVAKIVAPFVFVAALALAFLLLAVI